MNEESDWVRLQKALAIRAERGYGEIMRINSQTRLFLSALIIALVVIFAPVSYGQSDLQERQFSSLQTALTNHDFTVKLEIPPYQNQYGIRPYGLLEGKTKTIWINPVVFDLGNARPTLIHEATHAAQLCKGKGEFDLLNLELEPPKMTHPYFMRYHNYRREIEAEAYTVQVQPNSLNLATKLLEKHCSK